MIEQDNVITNIEHANKKRKTENGKWKNVSCQLLFDPGKTDTDAL